MPTPTYRKFEIASMLNTFHSSCDIISIKRLRNLVIEEQQLYMLFEYECIIDWILQTTTVVQTMLNADKA